MFSLRIGGAFSWGLPRRPGQQRSQRRPRAAGDSAATETLQQRGGGWGGLVTSGVTAGALVGGGNLAVQYAEGRKSGKPVELDLQGALRLFGIGALLYGPYQHYWFGLLDWALPARTVPNVLAKVAVSQLALAPAVLALVYSWHLALTGQPATITDRIKKDLAPSTIDGWKFWVPVTAANFAAVPLDKQVLFMSAAGVAWTAYVSHHAALEAAAKAASAAPPPPPTEEPKAAPAAASAAPKKVLGMDEKRLGLVISALWIGACVALKQG